MTIRNITDALTACGLPIPEAAHEWQATAATLRDYSDSLTVEEVSGAAGAMTPATAIDTAQRLTRQRVEVEQARTVCRQLIIGAEAQAVRAVEAEADALIAEARKGFDAAVKAIAVKAGDYNPTATSQDVLSAGRQESWSTIVTASAKLDDYARLWSELYSRPATLDAFAKTYDGDHWRRVDGQELFEGGNRWHALIAAGYSLHLNTLTETSTLIAGTPERELRWERADTNGFVGVSQVRA